MKEIYTYLSPFIAAFIASLITYLFTVRAKKHEILMTHKLEAFKAIQKLLSLFKSYYFAKLSEIQGNEFAPMVVDLPDEAQKSPLLQRQALNLVLSGNSIFLSADSRKSLSYLDSSLGFLCNLELNAQIELGTLKLVTEVDTKSAYEQILFQIDECIDKMYEELKLPT